MELAPLNGQGDINDPTVAIADPRGINGVDLKIDLQRRARSDLWQKYGELAGSADPFKVRKVQDGAQAGG